MFSDEQDEITWPVPRLFFEYGPKYKILLMMAIVASLFAPLASLLPTYMLQIAIDQILLQESNFSIPLFPAESLPNGQLNQLLLVAGITAGAAVISTGLAWFSRRSWSRFSQEVQHLIRTDAYEKIQRLGVDFFESHERGQILSVLNNDINQMNQLLRQLLGLLIRTVMQFLGVAIFLFYLNWQLGLVALVFVPALAAISWWFVNTIKERYETVRHNVGALNAIIENNLGGIRVIKAYTAENQEARRVKESSQELYDSRWEVIKRRVKFYPSMDLVNWIGFGVLLITGGIWIINGPPLFFTKPLSVGTLVAFLVYSQQLTRPMIEASRAVDLSFDSRASVLRILALRSYEVEVESGESATELDRVDGRVTFENVTFAYEGSENPALDNVSFEIESGSFVGIVGPTGSGKTTLTKLLLRFYDPDEGTVRVDGHDLGHLDLESLRDSIGIVAQEPYLFSGTVRDNIAYGTTNATDREIERVAKLANAHGFIVDLEDGYDTTVGQRGVKLSGGQRQRIAIARAIIGDPDVLILDEATSHVDNRTEALIQNALSELIENRTTFAVAHRLSTIRRADTILVIEDGCLVQSGTHEELLEQDGLYANLWGMHVGELEEVPERFVDELPEPAT